MKTEEDRKHTLTAGVLPPGSEAFEYDGDINAVPIIQPQTTMCYEDEIRAFINAKVRTGEWTAEGAGHAISRVAAEINTNEQS